MRIFIIGGKGSNGKNTIAEYIKEYYLDKEETTIIIGFADYIKILAKKISSWDGNESTKPRKLLQDIGQDIRNNIGEDFFAKRLKEDISFYQKYVDNIVIADARLPFEIEYIKHNFARVLSIKIERENFESNLEEDEKNHITEIALDEYKEFDYTITNENLEKLKKDIYEILEGVE